MSKFKDLTNQKFGRLLVLQLDGWKYNKRPDGTSRQAKWECLCDCGNVKTILSASLISGITKSCGCYQKDIVRNTMRKAPGESVLNYMYNYYKKGAKKRKLEFDLNLDEFSKIISDNCYYCNKEPIMIKLKNYHNGSIKANGIDRVDNNLGYIKNNVVSCCKNCNFIKSDVTINMVVKIYEFIRTSIKPN